VSDTSAPNAPTQIAKDQIDLLTGSGELGALMRRMDWAQTSLGPIEGRPQSLKTSLSICLASRFPIVLYWGPQYVVLYNDAYSQISGSKHPWAATPWNGFFDFFAVERPRRKIARGYITKFSPDKGYLSENYRCG